MEGPGGVLVGHWSDPVAATGCTVLLFPDGAAAAVDVRGSAPGTRETDVLAPGNLVERIHAVLLTGGSAFGLDAAGGVVAWCEERGLGYETPAGRVPIVVAAVIYDLDLGAPHRRPGPAEGRAACEAAQAWEGAALLQGSVGAGTGATVGKLRGARHRVKGGLGVALGRLAGTGYTMAAVAVANGVGDVFDPASGRRVTGAPDPPGSGIGSDPLSAEPGSGPGPGQSTTLAVVVTDLPLAGFDLHKVAAMAHDGIARAVRPAHTLWDGDAVFAVSTGRDALYGGLPRALAVSQAGALAADLVGEAIVRGVRAARSLGGVPGMADTGSSQSELRGG